MSHRPVRLAALLSAFLLLGFSTAARATELPVSGDAYVSSTRTTTNFGAQSNLYVDSGDTTYIQFDLSGLPSTLTAAQIAGAKVTFFVNRINTAGSISVSAVTSSWTEGAVTYSTKPAVSSTVTATATPAAGGTYVTVDITSLVQGWITTPASNYGIALTSTGGFVLDSKENDQTAHAASLNVTTTSGTTLSSGSAAGQVYLTGASGAVPSTPSTITGDITLSGTGIAAVTAAAGADIVAAVNAGSSVIAPAKLGTGSGVATTFLNGSGVFAAPIVLTTTGSGAASLSGNTLNIPTAGGGVGSVTYTNSGASGSASVSGTNLAITFPVAATTTNVSNTAASGSGTASISNGTLNINFPVSTNTGFIFSNSQPGSENNSTPDSYPLVGFVQDAQYTAGDYAIPVPAACTVYALYVRASENLPSAVAADTSVIVVRHNGSNTSMSCTTNNVATANSVASCSDTAHLFTVNAGDYLEYQITQSNGASAQIQYNTTLACH